MDIDRPENDGRGVDARLEDRPGVPMEWRPHPADGAHWTTPDRQPPTVPIQVHVGRDELTPVFGTAQPPRGLSGMLRVAAYRIPEHEARHWLLLLLADRVDVVESAVTDLVRRRPLVAALSGLGALVLVGGLVRRRFAR